MAKSEKHQARLKRAPLRGLALVQSRRFLAAMAERGISTATARVYFLRVRRGQGPAFARADWYAQAAQNEADAKIVRLLLRKLEAARITEPVRWADLTVSDLTVKLGTTQLLGGEHAHAVAGLVALLGPYDRIEL